MERTISPVQALQKSIYAQLCTFASMDMDFIG